MERHGGGAAKVMSGVHEGVPMLAEWECRGKNAEVRSKNAEVNSSSRFYFCIPPSYF
jgi:hypothetical protein